ncbi:MAG: hypothetical protein L0Z55_08805 [Planctomycetes bacterium]|nr:hypothetical protein [Planctomycetota bacterium]
MARQILPHVQAVILCDHIYRDDATGKCVLAGTFNRVYLDEFPEDYQPAAIYMNLSDFTGRHNVRFRFVRLVDHAVLTESPNFVIKHDDKIEPHECIFDLPPLTFPSPGRYSLDILFNGDPIAHAYVEALPAESADGPGVKKPGEIEGGDAGDGGDLDGDEGTSR